MSEARVSGPQRWRGWGFWSFIVLMLALMGLFVVLGLWQVERLKYKETLIAAVSARVDLAPEPLPPLAEWVGFDAEVFEYRPVILTGHFVHDQTILVFTALPDARGQFDGPGYWVMTPFVRDAGGTVFVNRGFVPQRLAASFASGGNGVVGTQTVTGPVRRSEPLTSFTPGADSAKRIDWVRNIDRLTEMTDPALAPFLPAYVDLPAGDAGALPQGGETVLSFPNNHFGYILTWFGFALITPILLAVWIIRYGRKPPAQGLDAIMKSQLSPRDQR